MSSWSSSKRRARAEQPEPRADARDVRVDRDVGHPVGEQQHARRRLAPDAGQRGQERARASSTGSVRQASSEIGVAAARAGSPGCARTSGGAGRRAGSPPRPPRRGASRTASQDGKRSRRRRKATSRLRSLVDCERTVRISSSSGCAVRRRDRAAVELAQAVADRAARGAPAAASSATARTVGWRRAAGGMGARRYEPSSAGRWAVTVSGRGDDRAARGGDRRRSGRLAQRAAGRHAGAVAPRRARPRRTTVDPVPRARRAGSPSTCPASGAAASRGALDYSIERLRDLHRALPRPPGRSSRVLARHARLGRRRARPRPARGRSGWSASSAIDGVPFLPGLPLAPGRARCGARRVRRRADDGLRRRCASCAWRRATPTPRPLRGELHERGHARTSTTGPSGRSCGSIARLRPPRSPPPARELRRVDGARARGLGRP